MAKVNDENARPNIAENASLSRPSKGGLAELGHEPEEELASGGNKECGITQVTALELVSVELTPLLEKAFGSSNEVNELIRAKQRASKYDFKARVAELSTQNRALKEALAGKLQGERYLAEELANTQVDLAYRLRAATSDAMCARRELGAAHDERGKLLATLQDAVRTVWREEAAATNAGQNAEPPELMMVRAEVEALRQRAERAEARTRQATRLVEEAGVLLKSQAESSERRHRALENDLQAALSRITELEAEQNGARRSLASTGVDTGPETESSSMLPEADT